VEPATSAIANGRRALKIPRNGARTIVDCDLHPAAPPGSALVPYLDDYWADQVVRRNIDTLPFDLTSYPKNAPIAARGDWRGPDGRPGGDLDFLRANALDRFGISLAICNVLHGVTTLNNPDMAAALTSAVNDWLRAEWLDAEPRLRGSILVTLDDPALAVAEIERLAPDPRFVQVLVLVMQEAPLGRRQFWPVYEAAERHGLSIGVHAGSHYRWAPSVGGWPSYQVEDYVSQSFAFENLAVSLLAEGVFQKFRTLKFVFLESGFLWLPTLMWRIDKTWRGVRQEVPWLDRPPSQFLRERVFVALQPVDAPGPDELQRSLGHLGGTDMVLFSTDYPHRQFAGDEVLPDGLPEAALDGILATNALRAYPRLAAAPSAPGAPATLEATP
jgi:hypothetical protein